MNPLVSFPLEPLWGSTLGLVIIMVSLVAAIGFASKSMAIGAMGGFTMFSYLATQVESTILEMIMIVSLVLITLGFAFKLWNVEGLGGGGGT